MESQWVVKRNDKERGPLTSKQLKEFAKKGQLRRDDWIRKAEGGKFVKAETVGGLFPKEEPEDEFDFGGLDEFVESEVEEEDEFGDEDYGAPTRRRRRKRSSSGSSRRAAAPAVSGGRKKKKKKRREEEEDEDDWWDPVSELYWGIGFVIASFVSFGFFMWAEKKGDEDGLTDMPSFIQFTYDKTGKWGVSVLCIFISLMFLIPAFKHISERKAKGKKINWRFPLWGFVMGIFGGAMSYEEEE